MTSDKFFEKFELFADTPDAVSRMRELILHEAFAGKLLPQTPHWNIRPLKSLATKIGSGATPDGGRESYVEEGIPLIRSMNVHFAGFVAHGLVYLTAKQATELANVIVQSQDVLLNITGASIGRCTTAPPEMAGARVNQHVMIIRPTYELEPRFLSLFLASPAVQWMINDIEVGATRQALTKGMIERFEIPLPPPTEQKRIVAKVDELMGLCDRLEAQQTEREQKHAALARASLSRFAEAPTPANLEFLFHNAYTIDPAHLRKAILCAAFQGDFADARPGSSKDVEAEWIISDSAAARRQFHENRYGKKRKCPDAEPFESEELPRIPTHWAWTSMDSICAQITDGEHIQPPYQSEGVPMLSAKHVRNGYVTLEGAGLITEAAFRKSIERCNPQNGDILIVSVGATTGRSAIVANCPRFAIVRSVLLLKPILMKEYLHLWLKNSWAFTWMTQASGASAQPHLYIRDLKRMPVPIAPLAEQRRIVAKVDQLMALVDQLEAQLAASRATAEKLMEAVVAELTRPDVQPAPVPPILDSFPLIQMKPIDLHAGILAMAASVHERYGKLDEFTHVKAEKIGHMVEARVGIDLGRSPVKDARGPNDFNHLKKVEHRARMAKFFDFKQVSGGTYQVEKLRGFDRHIEKTRAALGDHLPDVEKLLAWMLPMNVRQSEIVATVYAAWNNLLLDGITPTDEQIVFESRENWHPEKLKIERDRFFKAVVWLRKEGVVPQGKGKRVASKAA